VLVREHDWRRRERLQPCDPRLAFDEVVNLEDLGLAGQLDPDAGKSSATTTATSSPDLIR
jgi:hypothetical protein